MDSNILNFEGKDIRIHHRGKKVYLCVMDCSTACNSTLTMGDGYTTLKIGRVQYASPEMLIKRLSIVGKVSAKDCAKRLIATIEERFFQQEIAPVHDKKVLNRKGKRAYLELKKQHIDAQLEMLTIEEQLTAFEQDMI